MPRRRCGYVDACGWAVDNPLVHNITGRPQVVRRLSRGDPHGCPQSYPQSHRIPPAVHRRSPGRPRVLPTFTHRPRDHAYMGKTVWNTWGEAGDDLRTDCGDSRAVPRTGRFPHRSHTGTVDDRNGPDLREYRSSTVSTAPMTMTISLSTRPQKKSGVHMWLSGSPVAREPDSRSTSTGEPGGGSQ